MLTLHTMFGTRSRILDLLHAGSEAALQTAEAARRLIGADDPALRLAAVGAAQRREQELAAAIGEEQVDTFVTVLDREDIAAISAALSAIPRTIAKFATRYAWAAAHLDGAGFTPHVDVVVACTTIVTRMTGELRNGLRIAPLRMLRRQLQALETEGDALHEAAYRALCLDAADPMRVLLVKDLHELLESAIDRCRDVGNIVYAVVLKNH